MNGCADRMTVVVRKGWVAKRGQSQAPEGKRDGLEEGGRQGGVGDAASGGPEAENSQTLAATNFRWSTGKHLLYQKLESTSMYTSYLGHRILVFHLW